MPVQLSPSDSVLLSEGRRRLGRVHEGLAGLDRETRRGVRQKLVEAWHALEAAESGDAPVDDAIALLAGLEPYVPESAPPPFRPTFAPLQVRLLRRAVSDRLIDATFDRYAHRVDVSGFVQWLFERLPAQAVRAFEAGEAGPKRESPREELELVWKRPRRS